MAAIGQSNISRVRTAGSMRVTKGIKRQTRTVAQMTNRRKKSSGGAGG